MFENYTFLHRSESSLAGTGIGKTMLNLIRREIAAVLRLLLSEVCENSSFIELGGNSLSAIALVNDCRQSSATLDLESVLTTTSLTALLKSSVFEENRRKPIKNKPRHAFKKTLFTVEQSSRYSGTSLRVLKRAPIPHVHLSFIQGGQRQPGSNIIHYYQTYKVSHFSAIKKAWREVSESEPIFRTTLIFTKKTEFLSNKMWHHLFGPKLSWKASICLRRK